MLYFKVASDLCQSRHFLSKSKSGVFKRHNLFLATSVVAKNVFVRVGLSIQSPTVTLLNLHYVLESGIGDITVAILSDQNHRGMYLNVALTQFKVT